ncbi:hypothetical protein AAMO2058_001122300 [Amorphochlora amoebiformis]
MLDMRAHLCPSPRRHLHSLWLILGINTMFILIVPRKGPILRGGERDQGAMRLEGAEIGHVVTRFPPEPNGYLHIGHAKAAILNEYFARAYKGRLIVRFDDTNPTLEKSEYIPEILRDLRTLGIKWDNTSYTSDYFDILISIAKRLIANNVAYTDDTASETLRYERMKGIPSYCRNRSIAENLHAFQDMCEGTPQGLKTVLRIKMNFSCSNKACRDPVLMRTTSEYYDRNQQYKWLLKIVRKYDILTAQTPRLLDYSKLAFVRTVLSKRKLRWLVDNHIVSGWDDPRMPTIKGFIRRGLTPEGLRDFVTRMGASRSGILMEYDKLWALNRQHIDPTAPRFWAINKENVVPVRLEGEDTEAPGEGEDSISLIPLNKKFLNLTLHGKDKKELVKSRDILIDQKDARGLVEGEEITLMDWGNIVIKTVTGGGEGGGPVRRVVAKLNLDGNFKKTKKKIHWLSNSSLLDENRVDLTIRTYGPLLSKDKPEDDDDISDLVIRDGYREEIAFGDRNLRSISPGLIFQLERWGFYRVDSVKEAGKASPRMLTLVNVPDGKKVKKRMPL